MFTEFINNQKSKPILLLPNNSNNIIKKNIKPEDKKLPPINNPTTSKKKKKKYLLEDSINIIYKSLFPDERNDLDVFLKNYPNKYKKNPKWNYTTRKTRNDDNIRKELMTKNKTMRSYEYLRLPTKMQKIRINKPKMVKIIEDNFCYKYRAFLNPWEEEYKSYIKNKNSSIKNIFDFGGL